MIRQSWHSWITIAALAGALLASTAHQAFAVDIQGTYTCRIDNTSGNFELIFPTHRAQVPATGELDLEVTGNQIEIFRLRFTADPAHIGGLTIDPLVVTIDPAMRAVGPVRPFISSFVVPVGLLIENAAGEPVRANAELFASFVTDGISGVLGGQLPAQVVSPAGIRFSLGLACQPAPILVTIDKSRVCPGEDVVIEAQSDTGGQIWINGVPGARRILELFGPPGPRRILVTARDTAGVYTHRVRTVELLDCGPRESFPVLVAKPSVFRPHEMELLVDNAAALGLHAADYLWSFGDGTKATTTVPFVTHSYAEHLPVDEDLVTFEAEVTVRPPQGPPQETRKTITLWNHYAFNRHRGTLLLPTEVVRPRLLANAGQWTGEALVRNLESEPVAFNRLEIELQPCDGEHDPQPLPPREIALPVQSKAVATLPIFVAQRDAPSGTCGVAVHLFGLGSGGLSAQADAYFDLPQETVGGVPVEPEVSAQLNELATKGLVADANYVSFDELRRLRLEGRLPPSSAVIRQSGAAAIRTGAAGVPGGDEEPVPGAECNPSALGRPGLTCQVTDEFSEDTTPPRIANALKGDLLLHSECNLIGLVLHKLTVPQKYTHEAIMTQNYFELRHHTAPFGWYTDHVSGKTIKGDIVKYGWPGTLTMSVTDAFLGRNFADPEGTNRTLYALNLEPARCFDDDELSPPLVVKPDHELYTPEVRERLKRAADKAKEIKGHYRFYGFTDGSMALPENSRFNAPDRIDWAAGSPAAVSSTFIWTALYLTGVKLEGDLTDGPEDIEDIKNGARQDELTLDGQYFYDEEERRAGLEALYSDLERLQQEEAGTVLGFFGQTSDQLANCFAADRCSADDTGKGWKDPGVGRTTSPSNFLFWDKPKYGGSYGFSEPLVFRDGGYRRIHRWKASEGTGRVEVTVVFDADGSPVRNARVVLIGLDHPTDGFGKTVFEAIPQGTYELEATKTEGQPPQFFSALCPRGTDRCLVTLTAGVTST
ncbi:MAG: carboxypeptidase-like regulatory domain-containing protein, partial [Thermoanaerobaculia bacterium]